VSSPIVSLRSGLIASIMFASLLLAVPSASASTFTAHSGEVKATFSVSGTFPQAKNGQLTIFKSGKIVDHVVVSSKWCGHQCWPNSVSSRQSVVHVVRLSPGGPLDIVLDLYSGGAHCCAIEQVYYFNSSTRKYNKVEHSFGNPGVKLMPLGKGGSDLFLSADDRFAYAFTDYAASGMPIEIESFSNGTFQQVTKDFPHLITKDATQYRDAFFDAASSKYDDTVGLAAAWVADEDMLGHFSLAKSFLRQESQAGHLNSALSPIQSSGAKFVVALEKFLRHNDYLK
jgi:hypothetical protein